MKIRINRRMYNTDTARLIGYYMTPVPRSDFGFYVESLYQKRTGEYFLHGDGGPMTRYCKYCEDGSIGWGEEIILMTEAQARRWLDRHESKSTYMEGTAL